ncbi:DNA helicase-2/ATP-dependent DNA helicase PcrA [Methanococcus maripaludis]|uniref:DNA 3'-5' helicase n=1 Tax=Methanococcus maripaludis TaxID=39152 RepID=A0A7J9NV67_METMI|nr:ATP-dependent helicase [Methanococcus maripaludis]MBA2851570.1 DNA helicase-2/ATP-dependent DNA helicase PcrA [Methanococcus maripaludis]
MDLSNAITLKDSDEIISIEDNFKLCAGPGAGKTRFLINHIQNIVSNSKRLSKTRKIACITYTNTGVDTIKGRLKNTGDYVEVSTIHGFLYRHVLKPYLWILNEKYDFPLDGINGHFEVEPTYGLLEEWVKESNQWNLLIDEPLKLKNALMKLKWKLSTDGTLELEFMEFYHRKVGKYNINKNSYQKYKQICWKRGYIDHDDVLALSYEILQKEKWLLDVLRTKFPYILIDEFQDTSPIQSKIIELIANKETIVGVIGDHCQSIYSFQGADHKKFNEFTLKGMNYYKIENNYRSTEEIIAILNDVRNEEHFFQYSPDKKSGKKPKLLVGNCWSAIDKSKELCCGVLHVLTYENELSNILRYGIESECLDDTKYEQMYQEPNNRGNNIFNVIRSIEHTKYNQFKDAIYYMKKACRKNNNFGNRDAIIAIKRLMDNYDKFKDGNITNFYNNYLYDIMEKKNKISRGKIRNYYDKLKYREVAAIVNISEGVTSYRTIHKSKGDEFDNVLLVIQPEKYNEKKLSDFLIHSDIEKEENRIYYVALSRAKENLFINIPKLSEGLRTKLDKFDILDLP